MQCAVFSSKCIIKDILGYYMIEYWRRQFILNLPPFWIIDEKLQERENLKHEMKTRAKKFFKLIFVFSTLSHNTPSTYTSVVVEYIKYAERVVRTTYVSTIHSLKNSLKILLCFVNFNTVKHFASEKMMQKLTYFQNLNTPGAHLPEI